MQPTIIIDTLRCEFTFADKTGANKILTTPLLNAEKIGDIIQQSLAFCAGSLDIREDKRIINLGTIPLEQFSAEFYPRLATALNQAFSPLAHQGLQPLTAKTVGATGSPEVLLQQLADHPAVLPQLARSCLRKPGLQRLIKSEQPEALRLLLRLLLQTGTKASANAFSHALPGDNRKSRLTPGLLLAAAICYLQRHTEGQHGLSSYQAEPAVISMLTHAILAGELPAALIKALYSSTAHHPHAWLRPLWQQPDVRRAIEKHLSAAERFISPDERKSILPVRDRPTDGTGGTTSKKEAGNKSETAKEQTSLIAGAGVLLLWPLLPSLFSQLQLSEQNAFISPQAQQQAVASLDWLIWGNSDTDDHRLRLPCLLCGLPPPEEALMYSPIEEHQQEAIDTWLTAISQQLPGWQKCALNDIRQLFLQRPAEGLTAEGQTRLSVKPEAWDVLLAGWPWPLTLATFPWLAAPLYFDWPLPPIQG